VKQPKVVIVGGGIAGTSTFYYLTRYGIQNVLLLEKEEALGLGITRSTAGQIMLQMGNEFDIVLSQVSVNELVDIQKKNRINLYEKKPGMLTVSPGVPYSKNLQQWYERQSRMGIPTEIWNKDAIMSRVPILHVDDIDKGIFCKEDGMVDANQLVNLYAELAEDSGAEYRLGVEVIGIRTINNRIIGVDTRHEGKGEFIAADIIVNAAGLEALFIGQMVHVDLPLSRSWRFNGYTGSLKENIIPNNMPIVEVLHSDPGKILYIGPQVDSIDYTIGSFPEEKHGDHLTAKIMIEDDACASELSKRLPRLMDEQSYVDPKRGILDLKRCNGSRRCLVKHPNYPDDNSPILGPIKSIEGYYNSCGWGGLGITHGPTGGMLVAASIVGKDDLAIKINPFLLERFEE